MLGIVVGIMVWSTGPLGQSGLVGGAAVLLITAVAARMGEGDPRWLDHALGVRRRSVAIARATVGLLYAQGVLLPLGLALVIHQGVDAWRPLVGLEAMAVLGAGLGAVSADMWRARALWAYGPAGLLLWAGFVRFVA